MTHRQSRFTTDGVEALPERVSVEDLRLRKTLEATRVICPYCLYYGDLWSFSTRLKHKRGKHFISMSTCRCPECGQEYRKKTLIKVSGMSMEEFGEWFWGNMFAGWGFGDKVRWEKFKARLKQHFSYEDSQVFWDVYHRFKEDGGGTFEEYKRTYKAARRASLDDNMSSGEAGQDNLDAVIEGIQGLLAKQRRPITVASIQYMLESTVSARQVTRALETMEKEGNVVYTSAGWKLYEGNHDG